MADLYVLGVSHTLRPGSEVHRGCKEGLDRYGRRPNGPHRAHQLIGERICRKLQWATVRCAAQRRDLRDVARSADCDRGWRQHYNRMRPHSSLGYRSPVVRSASQSGELPLNETWQLVHSMWSAHRAPYLAALVPTRGQPTASLTILPSNCVQCVLPALLSVLTIAPPIAACSRIKWHARCRSYRVQLRVQARTAAREATEHQSGDRIAENWPSCKPT